MASSGEAAGGAQQLLSPAELSFGTVTQLLDALCAVKQGRGSKSECWIR